MMVRHISNIAAAAALLLLAGASAHAQQPAVRPQAVVELFTSQGCSSCPAADALFTELAKNPKLITLTLPVTYWDYLGWKDTLGQEVFSKRQKLYAKARGDGQIYTPQAVVNGAAHIVGSDKGGIDKLVQEQGKDGFPVKVDLSEADGALRVGLGEAPFASEKPAVVWLLQVSRTASVPIERGENSGKTVTYANVVRGISRIGEWRGQAATLSVPLETVRSVANADSYVVLVQADLYARQSAILGAARGPAK
ncbi:DUF1223 domain-containing protein [Bosea sp. (in: a-proteobacteria)]|jgi:hypothetical protein|uniref:DUF1223 domain-containing protein n=1 Tax=Bosea sp. (in: a-proteobacteria) TaxID=1871050 RepID=UPI002DDD8EB7|nr:DUF1223 domain-containing protein [Bosea sp. (in: a-proteobacteria)]HEV2508175.1 DUF1223 domain-containing protein [Bosea sp. (in: a-proteobacteria)]